MKTQQSAAREHTIAPGVTVMVRRVPPRVVGALQRRAGSSADPAYERLLVRWAVVDSRGLKCGEAGHGDPPSQGGVRRARQRIPDAELGDLAPENVFDAIDDLGAVPRVIEYALGGTLPPEPAGNPGAASEA